MKITKNSVVSIHYTLRNDNGEVLDSSAGNDPLNYLHGSGNLIPGMEEALEGRVQGDRFDVTIPPAKGYGELDERLIQVIPRSSFPSGAEVSNGMQFQASAEGRTLVLTVTKVEGDDVTVDGNHELAGQNLNFNLEVVEVRQATEEEISHGHVHGPGGAH